MVNAKEVVYVEGYQMKIAIFDLLLYQ